MDIASPQFGTEVKERMYELNITQTKMAEKLGISVSYFNDLVLEKRRTKRRRAQIVELLELLEKKQKGGKLENA